jgi:hypothetical protein
VTRLLTIDATKKEEDSESEPIDLLVDTIIGFLEKGTSFTRSIGNQSFALLSGLVRESTIDLIVMVGRILIPLLLVWLTCYPAIGTERPFPTSWRG